MWTCQRFSGGVKCGHQNPNRYQLCRKCAKRRRPRKPPAHLKALELPYEDYVAINHGVERCGICGREPSENRRLDRDHWHNGPNAGEPRGLLCARCNRALPNWMDGGWLLAAWTYVTFPADDLERAA